jgi:hypothetical protein
MSKYCTFFEEFKDADTSNWLYYGLFTLRRYFTAICIHFIPDPIFQICVSAVFTLAVSFKQTLIYLLEVRPYAAQITNFFMISNEFLTLLFFGALLAPYLTVLHTNIYDISGICIDFAASAMCLMCLSGIVNNLYKFSRFCRKKNQRVNAIIPTSGILITSENPFSAKPENDPKEFKRDFYKYFQK